MESGALATFSRSPPLFVASRRRCPPGFASPNAWRLRCRSCFLAAAGIPPHPCRVSNKRSIFSFASISSSSTSGMSTATSTVPPVPPPPSYIGTPVFWIGVGVALAAVFSTVTSRLKNYAMQQAFKTMMNQSASMTPENQFGSPAFPAGSPFPFSSVPQATDTTPATVSPSRESLKSAVTVDISPTQLGASESAVSIDVKESEVRKKYAFVDISPEELRQKQQESLREIENATLAKTLMGNDEMNFATNGVAFKPKEDNSAGNAASGTSMPSLSVDALEKLMEDPTVQKMVYPYLPEEMRNPETFKWMLQNPQYRQQLQTMLNNMSGSPEWDSRMLETLKNFDISSPEVKQQFDQIGLSPEQVVSKIMENPDIAVAFRNPRIQAAIMDCSQNPLNIAKYQNDKEVMDVFVKISQLFPGVTG